MRATLKQFALPALAIVLLVIIAFGAVMSARRMGLLRGLEFQVYDRWMRQRPTGDPTQSPCVIVGVTDEDIPSKALSIPDKTMLELLTKLTQAGAITIGMDVLRDKPVQEPRDTA